MKNIELGCLFFVLIMLVSCTSNKPVVMKSETLTTKTVTETVHDTVFKIEKDSSFYQALLECQDGKVRIKHVVLSEPGRTLKSPRVRVDHNTLQVNCETEAQRLFAQWKSKHIQENTQQVKEVPVITNTLTWWQETQIMGFWLLLSPALLIAIYTVIKYNFKTLI
ncbi:hypothetical protein [Flavobacterium praedii]|uniref:hypothetical protein n=1 Tax=Flavobacterium praedii TaxID=3002900 RepID=UPI002481BBD3|nr:hypothetical protein [Flavobacterium praedii]